MSKYLNHFAIAVMITILGVSIALTKSNHSLKPQTFDDFAKATVSITLNDEKSGGTGVILSSTANESIILTNKHVCQLIQVGGVVKTDDTKIPIQSFKYFPDHDLCLVKVGSNLGVNTVVTDKAPDSFRSETVAGHPQLLPTIITRGHFSRIVDIGVMVGVEACTGKETDQEAMMCLFMGAKPIIRKFAAQVVSSTILPGSSGSAVYNERGEISGLIFAGNGEGLSYGFVVPYSYIKNFLNTASSIEWQIPNSKDKPKSFFSSIFKLKRVCQEHYLELSNYCRQVGFQELEVESL